jgi:hypothetical protein
VSPVIEAAVAAARAGDLNALDALVDWPLSGVSALVAGLAGVDPSDRAALARQGLDELSSTDPATRARPLRRLRAALAAASEVRPADPQARREMIAALHVPGVRDVYDADGYVFAVTPDGDRLVVRT